MTKFIDEQGNSYGIGGPSEITGTFSSRGKLEDEVYRLKGLKYSQKYIADKCGVSESIITNIVKKPDTVSDFALLKHKVLRTLWHELNLEVNYEEPNFGSDGRVERGEPG